MSTPVRNSIALCCPGDAFSTAWNAFTFQLYAELLKHMAVFPPIWGYNCNLYMIRAAMLDKLLASEQKPDLVLWIDSDNLLTYEDFAILRADLDANPSLDAVAGWYWVRANDYATKPKVSAGAADTRGLRALTMQEMAASKVDLMPVTWCGFGAFLMRYSMLEKLGPRAFVPVVEGDGWGFSGDDVSFCKRAVDAGCAMAVDRRVRALHLKRIADDDDGKPAGMPSMVIERKAG